MNFKFWKVLEDIPEIFKAQYNLKIKSKNTFCQDIFPSHITFGT
jgi:hypothetical protein